MTENVEKLKEYLQPGKTFCPYLFLHYHLDTDKKTKLCCHAVKSIDNNTLEFSDQKYVNLRDKVLNNEKLSYCTKCYTSESEGYLSMRQRTFDDLYTNNHVDQLFDQIEKHNKREQLEPLWYDLRLSNNCNLKCIMCGPMYSSTWAKDTGQENVHLVYEPDLEISPNAYKIQLAGGEPFMIKKFAKLLAEVSNTECEIVVNTNATIVTKPLLDQLKRFSKVWLVISIDGYGEINDRIRQGSKWDTIVENIKLFQDCGFDVLVNTVLQKDNVNHLYELGTFLESAGIDDWIISPLFEPIELLWHKQEVVDYSNVEQATKLHCVKRNDHSLTLLQTILKEKK
jgi:sulfatase maturation enzyme AslB (radical SAM superfamily)